jgi:intein/homing endonuclease
MMRKTIFTIAITTIIGVAMLNSCQSQEKKIENAQDKVQAAQDKVESATKDLNQAIKDSIQQFRKESEETINENEIKIAEFRAKLSKENKEARARDEKKLEEMQQQNRDLKRNLEEFKEDSRDKWVAFRIKFKHDMENLGQAFKAFGERRK